MPQDLTERKQEYLDYIRTYIQKHKSAPRQAEIAEHFSVTSPTVKKSLDNLQEKGYLYTDRDSVTGYYIRVPERYGTTAPILEINLVGKVNRYGEIHDFPEKVGHFPTTLLGHEQENLFAVELWQHIPNASMQAGDLLIFDQSKTSQPGQIGIIRWGKDWLITRLYPPTIDENLPFYPLMEGDLDEWEKLIKELDEYLFWWPLAHCEETDEYFAKAVVDLDVPWRPIPTDHVLATAIQLDRPLTL